MGQPSAPSPCWSCRTPPAAGRTGQVSERERCQPPTPADAAMLAPGCLLLALAAPAPQGSAHAQMMQRPRCLARRPAPRDSLPQQMLPADNAVPMAATVVSLQSVVGALLLIWKAQHPSSSYAYLVTSFTLPIVWVPGLRCAALCCLRWNRGAQPTRWLYTGTERTDSRALLFARVPAAPWRPCCPSPPRPCPWPSDSPDPAPTALRRAAEGQEVVDAIRRLVSILIGILIPCVVQLVVFPVFARRQLTERLAAALEDSVAMLLAAAAHAMYHPKGRRGGKAAGLEETASLQRVQRKMVAGMDKLLQPTRTVRRAAGGGDWGIELLGSCL